MKGSILQEVIYQFIHYFILKLMITINYLKRILQWEIIKFIKDQKVLKIIPTIESLRNKINIIDIDGCKNKEEVMMKVENISSNFQN